VDVIRCVYAFAFPWGALASAPYVFDV